MRTSPGCPLPPLARPCSHLPSQQDTCSCLPPPGSHAHHRQHGAHPTQGLRSGQRGVLTEAPLALRPATPFVRSSGAAGREGHPRRRGPSSGHTAAWGPHSRGCGAGVWCQAPGEDGVGVGWGAPRSPCPHLRPHCVLTGPHAQGGGGQALAGVLLSPKPTEGGHPDGVPPSGQQSPAEGEGRAGLGFVSGPALDCGSSTAGVTGLGAAPLLVAPVASVKAGLWPETGVLLGGKLPSGAARGRGDAGLCPDSRGPVAGSPRRPHCPRRLCEGRLTPPLGPGLSRAEGARARPPAPGAASPMGPHVSSPLLAPRGQGLWELTPHPCFSVCGGVSLSRGRCAWGLGCVLGAPQRARVVWGPQHSHIILGKWAGCKSRKVTATLREPESRLRHGRPSGWRQQTQPEKTGLGKSAGRRGSSARGPKGAQGQGRLSPEAVTGWACPLPPCVCPAGPAPRALHGRGHPSPDTGSQPPPSTACPRRVAGSGQPRAPSCT